MEHTDGFNGLFEKLSSNKKLERDRGASDLQRGLIGIDPDKYKSLVQFFIQASIEENDTWEHNHAVLTGYKVKF